MNNSLCDSCRYALENESIGFDFDSDMIETIAIEFGSEVSDHICDKRESSGEISCSCACNL